MGATLGMDPAKVRAIARQLDEQANSCDTSRLHATQLINDMPWEGGDAAGLIREWTTAGSPSLENFAELLRGIAEAARQNAAAQEQTSRDLDGEGGSSGSGGSGSGNAGAGNDGGGVPDNKAWTRDGTVDSSQEANDLVQALQDMSPEDARAVWDSLTPEEQAQVMTAKGPDGMPLAGELFRMDDVFSPEQIEAFNQSQLETHFGLVPLSSQSIQRQIEADAGIVKGNLNTQTTVIQNGNGTYSVDVAMGVGGGISGSTPSGVDLALAAGGTQNGRYTFATEAEAHAFALEAQAYVQGLALLDVPGILADPSGFLEDHLSPRANEHGATSERIYDRQNVSGTAGVGFEEDGATAQAELGVTITRESNNVFGGDTYSGAITGSAEAGLDEGDINAGASVDASVGVAVAMGSDGNPHQVTLTMSGSAALEGGFVSAGDVQRTGGLEVSAQGTVTVTVPINEYTGAAFQDFQTALQTGDMELLQAAAQASYSESLIRVDSSVTTETSTSNSSWGVSDTITVADTTTGPVFVKVPGDTDFHSRDEFQQAGPAIAGGQ